MPFSLENLFGDKVSRTAEAVAKAIDELTLSKEERIAYELEEKEFERSGAIEMAEAQNETRALDLEEVRAILEHEVSIKELDVENTSDARNREIEVTKSDNSTLLQRNFPIYLSMFIFLINGFIAIYVAVNGITSDNETSFSEVRNFFFSCGTLIIGYYFGSSSQRNLNTEKK